MNKKVRVAIAGVGNCASSFIQAVYAAKADKLGKKGFIPGVPHPILGGYSLSDIDFSVAFDVNNNKVERDLSDAIKAAPNCTTIYFDVPKTGIIVKKSPVLDGVSDFIRELIPIDDTCDPVDVADLLQQTQTDVLVNLLPVGSTKATLFFVEAALAKGIAFVNCIPEKVACNSLIANRFEQAELPVLGDDMKSQIGATTIHRAILEACKNKGALIEKTYQLNFGGNTDFLNMQETSRKLSKKFTKSIAIESAIGSDTDIAVGPSDFVGFMKDQKIAYMNIEGKLLLGMNLSIELKLKVEDSPNAASVIIDAVRAAKYAIDNRIKGQVSQVCGFLFKNPPLKMSEFEALSNFEKFFLDL